MSTWEDEVEELIRTKGEALGVNAISKALNVPLSTMQQRLNKSRFVKTEDRKWDIAENVQNNAFKGATQDINSLLIAQATTVTGLIEMLTSNMSTLSTMIKASNVIPSVASSVPNTTTKIDKRIQSMIDMLTATPKLIKEHKDKINEEYHELLDNTDWIPMFIKYGQVGTEVMFADITGHIIGDNDELQESTIELLREFQKEK